MLTGEPWVRWPPAARSSPMNVSPGCISARNTAWLAWLPEFGCTLAKRQPNSRQARSIASVSAMSTILAAAVIAPARIAFGIFVGQHRALRLQHGARDDVLRGDQLDLVALAAELELDRPRDLRIGGGERRGEEGIRADRLVAGVRRVCVMGRPLEWAAAGLPMPGSSAPTFARIAQRRGEAKGGP